MRYIPLLEQDPPNEAWLEKAKNLLQQLQAAKDADERNKIIDANRTVWGELKDWLLEKSHGKCWFSEAKDCFSHWDVEHYRPKKQVKALDGTVQDGYWWLAFAWKNLRICGNVGNRKKGAYFPLKDGCARCSPNGDVRHEDPVLLDPADPYDPALLFFDMEGNAIPAPHVSDDWECTRVKKSIAIYRLDFPPLISKRKLVWKECRGMIEEYIKELESYHADSSNGIARNAFKQLAGRLIASMRADRELSAVARACVESTGDERLRSLLSSM